MILKDIETFIHDKISDGKLSLEDDIVYIKIAGEHKKINMDRNSEGNVVIWSFNSGKPIHG